MGSKVELQDALGLSPAPFRSVNSRGAIALTVSRGTVELLRRGGGYDCYTEGDSAP